MSTASEEPPISWLTRSSSLSALGTSRPTTCAPSRASTVAIDFPMPLAAPVTSADLPVERTLPVDRGLKLPPRGRSARPGRTRTPTSARARIGASTRSGPRRRARRTPAARSRRGGPPCRSSGPAPRARAARSPRVGSSQLSGGVPSTITRPAGAQPADRRVQERPCLAQLLAGVDPCRVEHECLERLVGRPRRRVARRSLGADACVQR